MGSKSLGSFEADVDVSGALGLNLTGIPTEYGMSIRQLPAVNLNLSPIEVKPLDFSFRLKEIPSIRVHFPVDYRLGFSLFGAEVFTFRICGQAQTITEPYVANPCEARASRLQAAVDVDREGLPVAHLPTG